MDSQQFPETPSPPLQLLVDAHCALSGQWHTASACSHMFAPTSSQEAYIPAACFSEAAEDSTCCSPSGKIINVSLNSPNKQAGLKWFYMKLEVLMQICPSSYSVVRGASCIFHTTSLYQSQWLHSKWCGTDFPIKAKWAAGSNPALEGMNCPADHNRNTKSTVTAQHWETVYNTCFYH